MPLVYASAAGQSATHICNHCGKEQNLKKNDWLLFDDDPVGFSVVCECSTGVETTETYVWHDAVAETTVTKVVPWPLEGKKGKRDKVVASKEELKGRKPKKVVDTWTGQFYEADNDSEVDYDRVYPVVEEEITLPAFVMDDKLGIMVRKTETVSETFPDPEAFGAQQQVLIEIIATTLKRKKAKRTAGVLKYPKPPKAPDPDKVKMDTLRRVKPNKLHPEAKKWLSGGED